MRKTCNFKPGLIRTFSTKSFRQPTQRQQIIQTNTMNQSRLSRRASFCVQVVLVLLLQTNLLAFAVSGPMSTRTTQSESSDVQKLARTHNLNLAYFESPQLMQQHLLSSQGGDGNSSSVDHLSAHIGGMDFQSIFMEWVGKHGKSYPVMEIFQKLATFKSNCLRVFQHNSQHRNNKRRSYTLAINRFADLTPAQFKSVYLAKKDHSKVTARDAFRAQHGAGALKSLDSPSDFLVRGSTSWDWTKKGVVSPVKNQGACASCWAFSAVGSVESRISIKGRKLVSLSEQMVMDCMMSKHNNGCKGGDQEVTFHYFAKRRMGIVSDTVYPYTAQTGQCRMESSLWLGMVTNAFRIKPDIKTIANELVRGGPVAASVNAHADAMQFYHDGVIDSETCDADVDHAITIVGMGEDPNGVPYWKVKNSYGATWGGLGGYFLIKRSNSDVCGINSDVTAPMVDLGPGWNKATSM